MNPGGGAGAREGAAREPLRWWREARKGAAREPLWQRRGVGMGRRGISSSGDARRGTAVARAEQRSTEEERMRQLGRGGAAAGCIHGAACG
jgi:hypothetical protein